MICDISMISVFRYENKMMKCTECFGKHRLSLQIFVMESMKCNCDYSKVDFEVFVGVVKSKYSNSILISN